MKAFGDFKKKQKCVSSNVFTFWKCIQYTIYKDKTKILKIKLCKKFPLFSFASSNSS